MYWATLPNNAENNRLYDAFKAVASAIHVVSAFAHLDRYVVLLVQCFFVTRSLLGHTVTVTC